MTKPKIIVTQDMYFTKKDTARFETIGDVTSDTLEKVVHLFQQNSL